MEYSTRQLFILYQFITNDVQTANDLAVNLNVSVRTIKKEINILKYLLKSYDAGIESIPGIGYQSFGLNNISFLSEDLQSIKRMYGLHRSNSERVSYLLQEFLKTNDWQKSEEIADKMYISKGTLQNDLIEVRKQLNRFDIELIAKPGYGLKQQGNNFNRYHAVAEYFFNNTLSLVRESLQKEMIGENTDLDNIKETVRRETTKVRWSYSNVSLDSISIHIAMVSNLHYPLEVDFEHTTIAKRIVDVLGYDFDENELAYLSLHLENKRILFEMPHDEKLDNLVTGILDEISNNFNITFSGQHDLIHNLKLHIFQMIRRLRLNLRVRNPLVYRYLREYIFASKITMSACSIIQLYYPDIIVNIDEFGYLLLYFQQGLMKEKKEDRIKICIDESLGRSESAFYESLIEENFPQSDISIARNTTDVNYDILVGANRREGFFVDINEKDIVKTISYTVNHFDMLHLDISKYFRKEFVIRNLQGKSRIEVMAGILENMNNLGLLKEYYDSNPFYEQELGNGVLHLQDLKKHISEPVCMFIKLETPIIWHRSEIWCIFIIKTKKEGDRDLYPLCDMVSQLVKSKRKLQYLDTHFEYETLINLLNDK